MFGEAPCLRRLHDALSSQPFVSGEHFLLLDRTLVEDYTVSLEKTRDSQELNRRASPGENAFAFDVRPEGEGGTLEGVVLLDRETVAPDVNAERLTLEVFRKERGPQAADSTLSDDLRLRSVERRGDSLLTLFDYTLGETGRFTYLARLRAGDIGGLVPPAWVQDLSSPNPTATQDPNRTLNLEKFVADLAQAAASAHRPVLAQFTLDVTKR